MLKVKMSYVSGSPIRVTGSDATIQIYDASRKTCIIIIVKLVYGSMLCGIIVLHYLTVIIIIIILGILLTFSSPEYIVSENNGSVTVTITSTQPVLTDTVIILTDVPTSGGARDGLLTIIYRVSLILMFCSH